MAFITTDVCAEVVLCDPNEIIQDCLPVGYEELDCRIAARETVPEAVWKHYYNFEDMPQWWNDVEYVIEKASIDRNGDGLHDDDINVVYKQGTAGTDWLSGYGLLLWLQDTRGTAQAESSLYFNDPIHFFFKGGDGDDRLEGANNADELYGESGNDTLYGLGGDDLLNGGKDNDHVYGGSGNDIALGGKGDDYVDGGSGDDEVVGGVGNDTLYGSEGNDNVRGDDGNDWMSGGAGNDWMSGGAGNDNMYGDDGDDCMSGDAGNDYMDGGIGNDIMLGGLGNDTMLGGLGNDQMEGGEGNDYVDGGAGNDLVSGGAGNDTVMGGDGDDIVRGGFGDDIMYGGDGCDQFVFCDVDYECFDTIKDFSVLDRDQIDIKDQAIDQVRVVLTGHDSYIFLDLMSNGEEVGRVLVESDNYANLKDVFEVDTTYGIGNGAVVQVNSGVMIDLPSTSVLHVEDGMFF